MRLIGVTVRNYRIHRACTVTFDPERTVIGGPNESGKSTLVEAIHRALFLRARGGGEPHQAMKPFSGAGHPEVELHFEAGGVRYHLHKRFSGQSGTTSLTRAGAPALAAERAEAELARILCVADEVGAKAACHHWAHLWAWQGASGGDPAEHANAQRDSLLQRLSQTGGAAAAMQSALDARVAKMFSERVEATFRPDDKPKAGTELARAEEAHAAAQRAHDEAISRLERLHQALRDHAAATRTLVSTQAELAQHREEHAATETRAGRLAELRREEASREADANAAGAHWAALDAAERDIAERRKRLAELRTVLAPQAETTRRLSAAAEYTRAMAAEALKACDAAQDQVRGARQQFELAAAWVALFDKRQRAKELAPRAAQAREVAATIAALTAELGLLPMIEAAQLKRLTKLETALVAAAAALHAMAAGIELLAADGAVLLGGRAMAPGRVEIVTEDTELAVGSSVRLRIRPGGGTSLADARAAVQDARADVQTLLDTLGVATGAAAADVHRRRTELAARIRAETTRLGDLDAGAIEQKLEAAKAECAVAEAGMARRLAALGGQGTPAAPVSVAAAQTAEYQWNERFRAAESAEQRARAARDAATNTLASANAELTAQLAAVDRQNREVVDLEAQLRLLLTAHGEDADRLSRRQAGELKKSAADAALAATRQAVAGLQPDLLGPTQARLRRVLDEIQRRQQEAEKAKAIAETLLRSDGGLDPEADLALAQASLAAAGERLATVRRRAEALRLLDQLFRQEQQSLADLFTRPLVNTVSVYLQALFGAGARAEVNLDHTTFSQIRVSRPAFAGGASVAFGQLSGGTKEQVAVAVRLAMAEILAANHDGGLPLVLDDAFANADPERVQQLQAMLDLAATRGLQIIVVTCAPSDYVKLGARLVTLPPPSGDPGAALRLRSEVVDTPPEGVATSRAVVPAAAVRPAAVKTE